ncbi:hypothetical protein DL1_16580 [Thioclava dalianensis]|uniref:Uncharacterized protein n=1 Tax=Thioclava dalianensis TaxID=1185766 RepID=A0A074U004_9RHOB|nr:hypothetical protein [Thioclava dalianensis]KEP68012.1 hypothetical protein DL1_16580 [Thioclava dalianensis]SFN61508.1 hypothetical protein SAMN05216224_1086 [Thioclava dalianensis]
MKQEKQTPGALAGAAEGQFKAGQAPRKSKGKAPTRQRKWRDKHPKRYLAHLAVANALRLGVMEKHPCAVCGNPKADAHHSDYDRPFDVLWLCRRHHVALHRLGKVKGHG